MQSKPAKARKKHIAERVMLNRIMAKETEIIK